MLPILRAANVNMIKNYYHLENVISKKRALSKTDRAEIMAFIYTKIQFFVARQ